MEDPFRPHAAFSPLPFTAVVIDDPFWSPRREKMRADGLPLQLAHLEANHHVGNFLVAAGTRPGAHHGMFYYDSDLYKWIEAASLALHDAPGGALQDAVERVAGAIVAAQQPDGYINTYITMTDPGERMRHFFALHELYNGGHLIEAGVSRFEATGKDDLLQAGIRFARFVMDWRERHPDARVIPGHQEIELALHRLARATGDGTFAGLARDLLLARGTDPHVGRTALANGRALLCLAKKHDEKARADALVVAPPPSKLAFDVTRVSPIQKLRFAWSTLTGRYSQQHLPVVEQREPTGHAVRATYMYCAMADWYMDAGDPRVLGALEAIWSRMVGARMHVTGGLGPLPMIEGWGRDHEVDDDETAYCETCAGIGNVLWTWRMFLATGHARYLDVMELALCNAMLGGWSLDGKTFTYANPLAGSRVDRREWFTCPCCPPNVGRVVAGLGGLVAARGRDGTLAIVQFIGARVDDGEHALTITSGFPWTGRVELVLGERAPPAIAFRVPAWARGATMAVDGGPAAPVPVDHGDGLALLRGTSLRPGTTVVLDFHPRVEVLRPHPLEKRHAGKVAIKRGPLVYCAEAVDNGGADPRALAIDPSGPFGERDLTVAGHRVVAIDAGGVILVPFFARGNRDPGPFATWFRATGAGR